MDKQRLAEVLQESQLYAPASPETLARLAQISELRRFSPGQLIFREGMDVTAFSIVTEGRVSLCMNVPARGDVCILSLGVGDVLAWSTLVGSGRMTATATSLTDVELLSVPADELLTLCERDGDFGWRLMRGLATALANRLLATRLQLLDLFSHDPSRPARI